MGYHIINIFKYTSLLYLFVVILINVSWPLENIFFFENFLFIPSFLFASFIILKNKGYYLRFSLITFCVFLSLFILELLSNQEIIFGHILYLLRWIKYGVVFVLTLYFYRTLNATQLNNVVKGCFLLLVGINIVIYLNLFGMGEYLQFLHSPKESFAFSNFHEPGVFRLGGTFINPNDNGIIFSLFFLLFALHKYLKDHYFTILAILMVLLTQSRTAMLLSVGMVLILIIYYAIHSKVTRRQIFIGLLTIIILFTFFSIFNFSYISTLFTGKAFESNSFVIRIENFSNVVGTSNEVLFIGRGVINDQIAIFGKYLDSELTLVIAQFGIVGLCIWLAFIFIMIKMALRSDIHSKVFISFVILYVGTSVTNLSFFNTQLGLLLFVFLGISFKRNYEINSDCKENSENNPT